MHSRTFLCSSLVNYNDIKRVGTTKVPWGEEIGGRCQGNLITFLLSFLLASISLKKEKKVFISSALCVTYNIAKIFFAPIFIQSLFLISKRKCYRSSYTLWCRKSMLKCVNDVSRLKAKKVWKIFKEHRIIFQSLMACRCESCFRQFPSQPRHIEYILELNNIWKNPFCLPFERI